MKGEDLQAAQRGNRPVVVITGLRQTGKTTFLQHQFSPEERRFLPFDDFAQLSAAIFASIHSKIFTAFVSNIFCAEDKIFLEIGCLL
jgi:predicted AAA+ superfamily ATPase